MKKYIITKSMNRIDCVNLINKIQNELLQRKFFIQKVKELDKKIKEKKRSRLRGNKGIGEIYATRSYIYKGIEMYMLINKSRILTNIFNISPIDAPYVQYLVIQTNGTSLIFTQHFLDRYNERVLGTTIVSYREVIVHLYLYNNIGSLVEYEKNNKIVQRIEGGFIFGKQYEGYAVLNTIYDSIEEKDDEIKSVARETKSIVDKLSKSEHAEFRRLYEQFLDDKIPKLQLYFFFYKKGIILDGMDEIFPS